MMTISLIDYKGEYWELMWQRAISRYLYEGEAYYKAWWYKLEGPYEFRNYTEVPLPVFTDWWN